MQKRWMLQALIGSGILNVALLGLLFYISWKESPITTHLPYRPSSFLTPPISEEAYEAMAALPYEDLVAQLEDKTRLHGGYKNRDIALGLLASKHDLDVVNALGREVTAKRVFEEGLLFPSLSDRDYSQVAAYIKTHQAPFTPRGLFHHLPQTAEAFCVTDPFIQVETLMHRLLPSCLTKPILLALCQEAGWELLEHLTTQQRREGDFSATRARRFLIDALYEGSRQAAYLLVVSSPGHKLDELDDPTVETVLDQLDLQTKEADTCCRHLMHSKRSRLIQELAKLYLGEYVEEQVRSEVCEHVVQNGESLWLIAKKYGCTIEALKAGNPHASGTLRPGMKLSVP